MNDVGRIAILGAGLIGCYVGGRLILSGADVILIGRPSMQAALADGMTLSDLHGMSTDIAASDIPFRTEPDTLDTADVIILCVKSKDTVSAAQDIKTCARPGTVIISLQNGVNNADVLRAELPGFTVLAGMVPFNVARPALHHMHQGTEGALAIEAGQAGDAAATALGAAGLLVTRHMDMAAVMWGKILLNLNNAVNALSGLPLKAQLENRNLRRVLAATQQEALSVLSAGGITPAQVAKVPPHRLPGLLSLPNWIFKRLAARMLKIDARARSSMADDLAAGRAPEVDDLNGAVVALAARHAMPAPKNALMVDWVHQAFTGTLSVPVDPKTLLQAINTA